jgi:predicted DNA-binding transcriptional regulator YafY
MMALLMGRRISENIFPEPLRGEICRAVDYLLNVANPDLVKCSFVSQMKLFSAQTGKVDEGIFDCVYRAWRDHVCLKITYRDYQGNVSEREIEPHALFFRENNWYIHAREAEADTPRSFMIHRIQNAELLEKIFSPDAEIYENIHFTLTPVKNVVLKFHKDIHDSIFATPFHEKQEIVWKTDDPVFKLVRIPEAPLEILVQRILSYAGKLVAVKPKLLKDKVREAASSVLKTLQT